MSLNERGGFEAVLREQPTDWATRLIYADWLEDHDMPEEADRQRRYRTSWEWMAQLAKGSGGTCTNYEESWDETRSEVHQEWREYTPDDLVEAGNEFIRSGKYLVQSGADTLRDEFSTEYWDHWSVLTGVDLDTVEWPDEGWMSKEQARRANPFSCSC